MGLRPMRPRMAWAHASRPIVGCPATSSAGTLVPPVATPRGLTLGGSAGLGAVPDVGGLVPAVPSAPAAGGSTDPASSGSILSSQHSASSSSPSTSGSAVSGKKPDALTHPTTFAVAFTFAGAPGSSSARACAAAPKRPLARVAFNTNCSINFRLPCEHSSTGPPSRAAPPAPEALFTPSLFTARPGLACRRPSAGPKATEPCVKFGLVE
eukprot:3105315-Rhodomonas_salina.1